MRQPILLGAALLLTTAVWAAGQGTPEEARAMAVKAAAYLRSAGPEKAFPAFSAAIGEWLDRDLYVNVYDTKGVPVALGQNSGLIGKSVIDLKDVDGKAFIREIITVSDQGWVTYKWRNPISKAVEAKTSYVIHTGDYFVTVGAYKK